MMWLRCSALLPCPPALPPSMATHLQPQLVLHVSDGGDTLERGVLPGVDLHVAQTQEVRRSVCREERMNASVMEDLTKLFYQYSPK